MSVFISLLRGVNVGQRQMKMAELKEVYEGLGYTSVQTYLQSGNVVFSAKPSARLSERIREAIEKRFGFEVPVLILTPDRVNEIIAENPLQSEAGVDPAFLHFTFLLEVGKGPLPAEIPAVTAERAVLGRNGVYLYCPGGYGRTKLSNTYFERVLKTSATTRNWRTILALEALARS
jgi:uncharacterized protein (DUF1697 family)